MEDDCKPVRNLFKKQPVDMASTSIQSAPMSFESSSVIPSLQTRTNLYCTTCGCNIYSCVDIKAKRCFKGHAVRLRNVIDGLYMLCSACDVVISREMIYCYRCQQRNEHASSEARHALKADLYEWCEAQKPTPPSIRDNLCTRPLLAIGNIHSKGADGVTSRNPVDVSKFQNGLDLYCTECANNIPMMLLDKTTSYSCGHKFPITSERDWLYRRCEKCCTVISDEMEFCYRCGWRNGFFKLTARRQYTRVLLRQHREGKEKLLDTKPQDNSFGALLSGPRNNDETEHSVTDVSTGKLSPDLKRFRESTEESRHAISHVKFCNPEANIISDSEEEQASTCSNNNRKITKDNLSDIISEYDSSPENSTKASRNPPID